MYVIFIDILLPQIFVYGFIDVLFLKVSHLCVYFWSIDAKIRYVRHLWVGEGVHGFSHDGWLADVTVCCSEVSLQFLHCSGKFVGFYWPKVKDVAFKVSAPALEVGLGFRLRAWLVLGILTYVLLGVGGLTLVPVSRDI